jgi:hypothetical protein
MLCHEPFLLPFNVRFSLKARRLAMTASPTPEQSARAILGIFKSQNCIAGDPLGIGFIKAQFLENHGGEAEYAAGLLYAEDSDWVEVSAAPDMQPHGVLTLTADGFAQI